MRRLMLRTAVTTALATAGIVAVPAAPANAVTLFECGLSWAGTGALYCEYVATTPNGRTTATIEDNYHTTVDVDCVVSGSGGWLGQSGTIEYNQIPGEICGVLLVVRREAGSARVTAGSYL